MKKSVSYDVLVIIALLAVPLLMVTQLPNSNNPYMNGMTPWIVTFMSVFVIWTVKLNQKLKQQLLDVLVLTYLLYWHLRFLTLAVFPQYDLVLTRTVSISANDFNNYAWVVVGVFSSAVAGFYAAHRYIGYHTAAHGKLSRFNWDRIDRVVDISEKFLPISIYFISMMMFHFVVTTFFGLGEKPVWVGYLSLFFDPGIGTFLMLFLFFSPGLKGKRKAVVIGFFIALVMVMVAAGSRSILVNLIFSAFIVMFVFRRKPSFALKSFLLIIVAIVFISLTFAYATFQRDLRSTGLGFGVMSVGYSSCKVMEVSAGSPINVCQDLYQSIFNSIEEGTEESAEESAEEGAEEGAEEAGARAAAEAGARAEIQALKSTVSGLFGYAFARAGYLDFSAEFYMNDNFDAALNFKNYGKSIIDNSVPGSFFDDSKRIEHRIRDVYNPSAIGYQSDALGVVGENYRLFGYLYPVAIFSVAFAFCCFFSMCGPTIVGVYAKYVIAVGLVAWVNSYGYDTLILDMSRELLIGAFVVSLVFFNWNKLTTYVHR